MGHDDGGALVPDSVLEASSVVANSTMNRERRLRRGNGYARELGLDPLDVLLARRAHDDTRPIWWLDLCCGRALAVDAARLLARDQVGGVRVVGVDLVDQFDPTARNEDGLELVVASITDWSPSERFDLITCVHGLHYVGDKLGVIAKIAEWLTPDGRFVANFDPGSIRLPDGRSAGRRLNNALRSAGFEVDLRRRRLTRTGGGSVVLPYRYLGANPDAGPNYTGQPAVSSCYAWDGEPRTG